MSGAVIARAIAELEAASRIRTLTDVESRRLEKLISAERRFRSTRSSYAYVRRVYGVDPIVGLRVRHLETGRSGLITREGRSDTHYVRVIFEGDRRPSCCHPTALDYMPDLQPTTAVDHVATCSACDRRSDDPRAAACTYSSCGLMQRRVA